MQLTAIINTFGSKVIEKKLLSWTHENKKTKTKYLGP
jgi:hypothetical protein